MELLNTLKGLGTAVNVCAVIAGGLIGTLFGKKNKGIDTGFADEGARTLGNVRRTRGRSFKNADNRGRQTFIIRNADDDYKSVARNAYRRAY